MNEMPYISPVASEQPMIDFSKQHQEIINRGMPGVCSVLLDSDWLSWVSRRSAWQQPPHPPSNPR